MTTPVDADVIAAMFDLGEADSIVAATSGWGGHNVMWRIETERGVFAVKQLGRDMTGDPESRFAIERAAFDGGVPMPRPVPARDGQCWAQIGGTWFRAHEWVHGTAGRNEVTTPPRARRMGAVVAHLHGLCIEASELLADRRTEFGREHWESLVTAAVAQECPWSDQLSDSIEHIITLETRAVVSDHDPNVGSHRDLNAHNVLFSGDDLQLIDWDAAGMASPRFERMIFAALWSERPGDHFDVEVAKEFLRGYMDTGGTIAPEDADTIDDWVDGLVWWTEQNIRLALTTNRDEHHESVALLIPALLNSLRTTERRKLFLRDCVATL